MNRPRVTVVAVIAAAIAGLYALDMFLERLESSELHSEAQNLYSQGERLLAAGRAADAIQPLEHAHTLERQNRRYQLAYAEALIGAGRRTEAATILADVTGRAPNDGKANLLLARLARADKDFTNEAAYYHRAIYGAWDQNAAARSSEARLEWIRELAERGDRKRLLGELLPLEAETQDLGVLKQVAHYLIAAGSPGRAAELYRTLIETHADDTELMRGLGQAETLAGEYAAAQTAYRRAFMMRPGDASIRHEMELASQLSGIDPTPRRISSREKYDRSTRILRLVRDSLVACGANTAALAEAERMLNLKHPDTSNEASEQVLQLAEFLWQNRPPSCSGPAVLPVLMQKLSL